MTREEAVKTLTELWGVDYRYCLGTIEVEAVDMAIEALKQPEIIRCEGCRYYADGHCDMHNMGVDSDDFCSYAVGR